MKMTRFLICIVCICAFLCGCFLLPDQHYACEAEDVRSVQIVRLGEVIEGEYRYDYTILHNVEDKGDFIRKLNDIRQTINWGDPYVLYPGYVVIRIEYINSDCDLVYSNAQSIQRGEKKRNGYACFNKEQFNALISEYISGGQADGSGQRGQGDGSVVP